MSNLNAVAEPRDATFPKIEVVGAPHRPWLDNPELPQIDLLLPHK
jgi:hypothetical protein